MSALPLAAAPALQGPPPPRVRLPFEPPQALRVEVEGLRLLLVEQHAIPLVTLAWTARAGSLHDPEGLAGLAALTAPLLREGTARRSAPAMAAAAEELGTDVLAVADWDLAFAAIEVLPEDLAAGVELMAELVAGPVFPEPAVEAARARQRSEAERRRLVPASLADDELARAVYGSTPYGRPRLGEEASFERLTRQAVAEYHRRHWWAAESLLVAVGDFDPGELLRRAAAAFPCRAGREKAPPVPGPLQPAAAPARAVVVDLPDAVQTELRVGHASVPRSDPDFDRLQVLNAILGGSFGSRLNLALREESGHAYRVDSRFAARGGPGPFVVSTAVASDRAGAVAHRILAEMERLRDEEVPAEEIAAARARVAGSLPRRFVSLHGICTELATLEMLAPTPEHLSSTQRFEIDGPALRELARRHLRPEEAAVVACGPAAVLEEQLAGLGLTISRSN